LLGLRSPPTAAASVVHAAEAFVASVRRDGALAALIAATAVEVDGALAPPLQ
jgi:hypothetical protein